MSKKDLTASFKIKNQQILDKCEELIKVYRNKVNSLNLELNSIDIDTVLEYLKRKDEKGGIDFISFARKWCMNHQEIKGIKNYLSAINSFCTFFGRETILCSEITVQKMREYENHLSNKKRARSLNKLCKKLSDR